MIITRRGECCGLKWSGIDFKERTIHTQRNVVKVTSKDFGVKDPKTTAGERYVYFSPEMASLLKEYWKECRWQTATYYKRQLTDDDYVSRRNGFRPSMTLVYLHMAVQADSEKAWSIGETECAFAPIRPLLQSGAVSICDEVMEAP